MVLAAAPHHRSGRVAVSARPHRGHHADRLRPDGPKALAVAEALAKDGISVEVIDPRTTSPLDEEAILASARKTGRVVVVHEASRLIHGTVHSGPRSPVSATSRTVSRTYWSFRPGLISGFSASYSALAAILAMIPLSRSAFWGPMAITIMGGLTKSHDSGAQLAGGVPTPGAPNQYNRSGK